MRHITPADFRLLDRRGQAAFGEHARAWLRALDAVTVFGKHGEAATLLLVTTAYGLVAALLWKELFCALIDATHAAATVKIAIALLAVAGDLVVANELIGRRAPAQAIANRAASRIARGTLPLLLGLTALYWVGDHTFARFVEMAKQPPLAGAADALDFALGNLMVIGENIFLPIVGAAFLAKAAKSATRHV